MLAVIHLNDDTDGIYSFAMVNLKFKVDSMCVVEDFSIVVVWAMNHKIIEKVRLFQLKIMGKWKRHVAGIYVDASEE